MDVCLISSAFNRNNTHVRRQIYTYHCETLHLINQTGWIICRRTNLHTHPTRLHESKRLTLFMNISHSPVVYTRHYPGEVITAYSDSPLKDSLLHMTNWDTTFVRWGTGTSTKGVPCTAARVSSQWQPSLHVGQGLPCPWPANLHGGKGDGGKGQKGWGIYLGVEGEKRI